MTATALSHEHVLAVKALTAMDYGRRRVAFTPRGTLLFYWWPQTIDTTPSVFMALINAVACAVGGVMLALMSGPFASVVAAAPHYGNYHCARTGG